MKQRRVVLSPAAQKDLRAITDWLADETSPRFAAVYARKIVGRIKTLTVGGERGTLREINGRSFRLVPILSSISIAFDVTDTTIVVFKVIHGGRNWEAEIAQMYSDDDPPPVSD
jgi:plasmid stabilization system protein ParE